MEIQAGEKVDIHIHTRLIKKKMREKNELLLNKVSPSLLGHEVSGLKIIKRIQ